MQTTWQKENTTGCQMKYFTVITLHFFEIFKPTKRHVTYNLVGPSNNKLSHAYKQ